MNIRTIALAAVAGAAVAAPAAFAEHSDALLLIHNGQLVTGTIDFDTTDVTSTNARVFEGEFDAFGTTDEPGFNGVSPGNVPAGFDPLPGNTPVEWDGAVIQIDAATANLWHWDGVGGVAFAPVTDGTILNVSKAPSMDFTADFDGSANPVDGFEIETTDANGFLHKHIDLSIIDANTAATGFYLWSFELSVGGLTTEPIFFVHGLGIEDEEAHEAAIDWVQFNLVPGPGAVAAFGVVGLGALRRRRSA